MTMSMMTVLLLVLLQFLLVFKTVVVATTSISGSSSGSADTTTTTTTTTDGDNDEIIVCGGSSSSGFGDDDNDDDNVVLHGHVENDHQSQQQRHRHRLYHHRHHHHKRLHDLILREWSTFLTTEKKKKALTVNINATTTTYHNDMILSSHHHNKRSSFRTTTGRRLLFNNNAMERNGSSGNEYDDSDEIVQLSPKLLFHHHETIDNNMDVSFAQRIHELVLDTIHGPIMKRQKQCSNSFYSSHDHRSSWHQHNHHHSSSCCNNNLQQQYTNQVPSTDSTSSRIVVGQNYLPDTMYGADPTGLTDSTFAFQRLVKDILTSCNSRKIHENNFGGGDNNTETDNTKNNNDKTTTKKCPTMASGIVDLGGATIDLEGGSYMISEPIYIPPFFGNFNVANGKLIANPDHFSTTDKHNNNNTKDGNKRWLIEIGNLTECLEAETQKHDPQNSCHEYINLHHLLLDANHVAAGGVKVSGVMGATIEAVFVTHFPYVGIQIDEGHEVMISNCWLAEWYWKGDHQPASCHKQHSIGIQINGFDHYITNTVIFHCTKVGVQIRGGANVLDGVHTWNGGGTGIEIIKGSSQNRLIGCYLDWNSLDLYTPIQTLTVEFGFFLQTGIRLISPNETSLSFESTTKNKILIDGLILRSNSYSIWDTTTGVFDDAGSGKKQQQQQRRRCQPIEVIGHFPRKSIKNVQVMDDFSSNKATKVSKSLLRRNSSLWTFEFEDELLFPFIDRVVSYTVVPISDDSTNDDLPFFQHMILPIINGTTVQVVTSMPIDATVHIVVEQG